MAVMFSEAMGKYKMLLWVFVIIGEVLMYGGFGILVNLSKVNGQILYHTSSLILCIEMLKLLICLVILWLEDDLHTSTITLASALPYALPALCYTINNNLAIVIQKHMDPATYMVLGNLKIVTTAVLYKAIMKRSLSQAQWISVGLLTLAGCISSTTALKSESLLSNQIHTTWFGLFLICGYCVISGFSGVYTEFILKKDLEMSVYYQNALLYMFGIMFNFALWLSQNIDGMFQQVPADHQVHHFSIFTGYSVFTWALIITQAAMGVIMSLVMKHLNNIVRLFIISSSPLVTTAMAAYIFNMHVPVQFFASLITVVVAVFMYGYKKQ